MFGRTIHIGWLLATICLCWSLSSCSRNEIQSNVEWGSITGDVRSIHDDRPLKGCIVTCAGRTGVIGDDGRYWLYDIAEGYHELSATQEGFDGYRVALYIGIKTEYDIYMSRSDLYGSIYGQVFLGQDTTPLTDVEVMCADQTTQVDANGHYSIPLVYNDRYTIRARKQNHIEYRRDIEVFGDTEHDIHLAATSLNGWVTNAVDGPVAGARVTLAPSTTVTNEFGEFHLDIVPQGLHYLTCTHPNYNTTVMRHSLAKDQPDQVVNITRTVIDTIWIASDASISSSNYTICEECPDWGDVDANHGQDAFLRLAWFMRPDLVSPTGAWMARSRAILSLPDLPPSISTDHLERAIMILSPVIRPSDEGHLSMRRVRESAGSWSETELTWSSMPDIYWIPYWIGEIDQVSYEVDVSTIYYDERDLSRSLVIQRDESGPAESPRELLLHSSETELTNGRPMVEIQYTR